ncbi:MAG: autotransporter-associated beta strand repeat-containing protein [Chthoniobacter sp.]|nr:autotransporter-associated beta strand repeat-containing protein [Chthoniobacter sp.]
MKNRKPSQAVPRQISRRILSGGIAAVCAVAILGGSSARAATLYWDTNGTTLGSGGATGTWGTSTFWSTDLLGLSVTTGTVPTSADDAIFSVGTNGTGGTITISGTQVASSIVMDDNVALTFSGGTSLTIGGTGAYSGIFVANGDNSANNLSTALILGANSTIQNGGTGTLTISGGITGTADLVLANNNTTASGVTISGTSLNNTGAVTNFGFGSGQTLISAVIGTNVTSLTQNSTTSALSLTAANTYTGATNLNSGTMTLSGATATINASTALNFNGGTLTLTNTSTAEGGVDRVGAVTITSNGGTLNYNNTVSGQTYAETVGTLALVAGQFNTVLSTNMAAGSQTLTFGGLTHTGSTNTSTATFSSGTALNATTNMVKVAGATATGAGQIIGPWATTGTSAGVQTDYAIYDGSTNIVPRANAADEAENTWAANAFNMTTGKTLTGTRTITAIRNSSGNNDALSLAQSNLETFGILKGGGNTLTISGTSGVLRQNGTAAAPVYVTTGAGNITISANIADNTGALTLVKAGSGGNLILSGLNSYTGGLVINQGEVRLGATNSLFTTALGTGTTVINTGTIDPNNTTLFNQTNNALTINGDFTANSQGSSNFYFGTGAVSLGTTTGMTRTISVNNGLFTLGGVVSNGAGSNSITKAGGGNLVLSGANIYTGGTNLFAGNLMLGGGNVGSVGAITSSPIGTGALVFRGGGISSDSLAARTILNPVSFNPSANATNHTFGSNTNNAIGALTFSAPVDLGLGAQTLTLNSNVQFDGVISSPSASLVKTGVGMLTLNAAETYGGNTSIAQGTLRLGASGALPAGTNVSVAGTVANQTAVLDLNGISATIGTLSLSSAITVAGSAANPNATGSSLVTIGNGTLTLGGDLTYAATNNPFASTIASGASGALALGAASRNFTVANSTTAQSTPDLIVSANITGGAAVNLTLNGAGTVLFAGNNSYQGSTILNAAGSTLILTGNNTTIGATTITNGTVIARSANALGGSGNTAGVSVATGRNFTYNATTDAQLAIGGALAITGGSTFIGTSIGNTGTSSRINVTGDATISNASHTVNIYGVPGVSHNIGLTTLISGAGGGSSLAPATVPTLGTVFNNTDFTINATAGDGGTQPFTRTATDLKVTTVTATALSGNVFWKGGLAGNTGTWAASNGTTQSNWMVTDTVNQPLTPGATTDLVFSTATSPGTMAGMSLGSDMSVRSITVNNAATAFGLSADPYTLTITPSDSTKGIALNNALAASPSISALLSVGAAQTWTNISGQTFSVNNNVNTGSSALTISGQSGTTILGTISGSGSITKNSNSTLILNGYNTFSGGITVNQGEVQFGNPNAFGTGTLTLNRTAVINSNFANLINANNNAITINGDFTSTGSQAMNLGTGTVSLGTSAGLVRTLTVNTNQLTLNGIVSNGTTATGIVKTGNNTLLLGGASTYTGQTIVNQGTIKLGTSNAILSGNAVTVSGNAGNAATLDLNGFNQTLGSLTMSGTGNGANTSASNVINSNVASPSTLTLTGGATAFTYNFGNGGFNPAVATISVNTVNLNGGATFNIMDSNPNPDVNITGIVQNGDLTKINSGQLALQGVNTYAGATNIYGGQVQVSGNLGTINQSSGIAISNGGSLLLTNGTQQTGVNRVKDTAGITSYGGNLQFNNTSSAGVVYAETVGALDLKAGQFDVILNTDMTGGSGNAQTLTLGGLTRTGTNTSVVTFSATTTNPNTTTNIIKVSGATGAGAGQNLPGGVILGPWATVGNGNNSQRDYAVYDASGNVIAANITGTAETTWTDAANAYTLGTTENGGGGDATLTGNRTMMALRDMGSNANLTLNNFNLRTNGLMYDGNGNWSINTTSGTISTSTVGAASLYISPGFQGGIFNNTPIVDNGGALTLVKSGYQNLYLRATNSYTGGTVINAGTLFVGQNFTTSYLGTGTVTFAGGAIDNDGANGQVFSNAVTFNGAGTYGAGNNLNMGFTGAVSLGTAPGVFRSIGVSNSANLNLSGVISNGTTVFSIEKVGSGNLVLSNQNLYTGDTIITGGNIQLAAGNVGSVGSITSTPIGTGRLVFNGSGAGSGGISSNGSTARTIINPVVFTGNATLGNPTNQVGGSTATGKVTLAAGIDLGFAPRTINVNSDVEFSGLVTGTGGAVGGGITKAGAGTLTLTNAGNNYDGPTSVVQGILKPTVAGALPALTNVTVTASLAQGGLSVLDLSSLSGSTNIGTLQMGGYGNSFTSGGNTLWVNGGNTNPSTRGQSLVSTGAGTLVLGGDLTFLNSANSNTATITGNLNLGTLNLVQTGLGITRSFAINDSTNAGVDMEIKAVIANSTATVNGNTVGIGINKTGAGLLLLSANNAYTGQTILNGGQLWLTGNNAITTTSGSGNGLFTLTSGTLVARSANALGGVNNTGGVTMATQQTLNYNALADGKLFIGGNLAITGGTTTIIGGTIGTTAGAVGTSSSQIDVTGAATVNAAGVKVNVFGTSFSGGAGTYTLIHGGAGSTLSTGTGWGINFVYNNTNFTVAAPVVTATDVTVTTTAATALTSAYWRGNLIGATQVWAASTGVSGGTSNWATSVGGTRQEIVPGSTTDVFIAGPIGGAVALQAPNAMTLGSDMSIKSLTVNDYLNDNPALNADGYTLTIGTGGINLLALKQNQTFSINPNITLNGSQTWLNNSPLVNISGTNYQNNTLTVNGNVDLGANALTLNYIAGQGFNINGNISNTGTLVKTGASTVNISGTNTFSGGITVNQGSLQFGNPYALGTGTLALAGGNIDSSFGNLINFNNNAVTVNADFRFNGSQNFNLGTGAISLGTTPGASRTIYADNNQFTLAGIISNGTTAKEVVKAGNGTLVLAAANAYTGATTIIQGTLKLGVANGIPLNSTLTLAGYANNTSTLDLNGFNFSTNNLTMSAMPQGNNQGASNLIDSNPGTNVLTLTGGANALNYYAAPNGFQPGAATISVAKLDLNGGATFNVQDSGPNPDVNITSVVQNGAVTKNFGGQLQFQGANTYTGATNIYGGQITVSGDLGTINQSASIAISNGGSLLLTNGNNAAQIAINRVGNSAGIAAYGGNLQFNNTAAIGANYAETVGTLTLNSGQFDVILNTDQTSATNTQTLTLAGLSRTGATNSSVITFSATTTNPNATTNIIKVSGATGPGAGQNLPGGVIIGPWATVGNANNSQRDYAVYDASGNVIAANITGSAETTWTNAARAYTLGTTENGGGGDATLTGNRTMMALRDMGSNANLNLSTFNLRTDGLIYDGNGNWTISTGGGNLSTATAGAANLYVSPGFQGNIFNNANIVDNGGALTLVKSGYQNLYLRGSTNAFTGGVVLNAGTLFINGATGLGTAGVGTLFANGGSLDNDNVQLPTFSNAVVINSGFTYGASSNFNLTLSGTVSLGTAPGTIRQIGVNNSAALILTNVISTPGSANSIEKTGSGNLTLTAQNTYAGDTIISAGAVQLGANATGSVGAVTSGPTGVGRIVLNGGALVSDTTARTIINPVAITGNSTFGSGSGGGKITISSPVDLGFAPRLVSTSGDLQIDGLISGLGGANGGGIVKGGAGTLLITNPNNTNDRYDGVTAVMGGTLRPTVAGAIPTGTNLTVSNNLQYSTATFDLNNLNLTIGTLTMGSVNNNTMPINSTSNTYALVTTGTGTLTLGGDVNYINQNNAYTSTVSGKLELGTANLNQLSTGAARNFGIADSSQTGEDMNISAVITGSGVGINKSGSGTLVLSAASNTFTGPMTVTAGTLSLKAAGVYAGATNVSGTGSTLLVRNATALNGAGNNVTMGVGTNLTYVPTANAQMTIGGSLSITGGTSTTIGTAIGSSLTGAAINVTGAASISNAAHIISIRSIDGITTGATGTYTLITGGAGSSLNPVTTPTLGVVYNNTNFTVGALARPDAQNITVAITNAAPITTAYWRGGLAAIGGITVNNVMSASNGSTASNWALATSPAAVQALIPGSGTDLFFDNLGYVTGSNSMTLGADMSIKSLTMAGANETAVINADGYKLTIGSGGITSGLTTTALNVGINIYADVTLGAAQTWTENSTNGNHIQIFGNVNTAGNTLTTNAAGQALTIFGAISGGGGLTKTGGSNVNLYGTNTYTGATTLNQSYYQLAGQSGAITQSSGITFNQGQLQLTSGNANESFVDRLGDSIPLTSYGGVLYFNNSANSNTNYAETVGAVTTNLGQFDVYEQQNSNGVANNSQVLTLSGLTHNATSVITFSASTTQPNTTTNVIKVTGATATPAGQIIGGWATTGTDNGGQRDFAVYDASGRVLPAGIAGSVETTWTNASNAYTTGTVEFGGGSGNATLTGTRTIAGLRDVGSNDTLTMNQFNLETNALLADSNGNWSINATSGVIRQNGTAAANLYVMNTFGGIIFNVPVQNNTGALTLVKSGSQPLYLQGTGANTYSGGLVLNSGTTYFNSVTAGGSGTISFNGGSIDQSVQTQIHNINNNAITINADFTYGGSQTLLDLGTGAITLGTNPGTTRTIYVNGNMLQLGGAIANGTTANSLTKSNGGTLILNGSNTYTGATAVNQGTLWLTGSNSYAGGTTIGSAVNNTTGTLIARNAGALGSGNVSVATNSALIYQAGADAPLSIGGNLTVTGGSSTILGGSIGATATSSQINVTGAATISNAAHTVNVYGLNSVTPLAGTNTYTLIQGGGGSSLNPATAPTLGTVFNNTNFTVANLARTAGTITVDVTKQTGLTTAYWKGGLSNFTQVMGASNGSTASNWATASGGAVQALIPGSGTDVFFDGVSYAASDNNMTMGADMTVKSLTATTINNNMSILNTGYKLTVGSGGLTLGTPAITNNLGMFIYPSMVLSAPQTWTSYNTNGSGIQIFGDVNNSGNLLTVSPVNQQTYIYGVLSGGGGLTKTGGNQLNIGSASTYTGATTINAGTLALGGGYQGASGSISQSSSISINAGNLQLNNGTQDTGVDRLGNGAPIAAYNGVLYFNNSASSGVVYAETMGAVTASGGQFDVYQQQDQNQGAGNKQTLTLTSLSHPGTAAVTFSATTTQPNTTTNVIKNTAFGSATPAGQIIGAWATTGNDNGYQRDYAVYDASGNILPANIAGSNETTWTDATKAYTTGTVEFGGGSGTQTLTGDRTMAALRDKGSNDNLNLGIYNLQTNGLLNNANGTWNINGSGGVLRQNTTSAANLYVTNSNQGEIFINVPIQDNVGALTLVKSGYQNLRLRGTNSFTGGTIINSGTLFIDRASSLGTGPLSFNGGSIDSEASTVTTTNSGVTINADFTAMGGTNNTLNLGAGAVTLGSFPGTTRTVYVNNNGTLILGGAIGNGTTANSLTKANSGTLILNGANTYTGTTAVTGGTLIVSNATGLGVGGNVTVAAGTSLKYAAAADAQLAIGGTLAITGNATIGAAIGAGLTSAAINVTGAASATGTITVNLASVPGTTPGAGTYTLIQGGGGSSLNGATFQLGASPLVYNDTNYSIGALTTTATNVTLAVNAVVPITTAYWTGGLSGAPTQWAVSNGTSASNWVTAVGGGATVVVPGPTADVFIAATTTANNPNNMTLGANMSVQSLTFTNVGSPNDVNLNADGYSLTIGTGGITMNASSPSGGNANIYANLIMGSAQAWTQNNGGRTLVIAGSVANGGNLLTIAGSGPVNIDGSVSGGGGITKSGSGTLNLGGANSFGGALTFSSGTVNIYNNGTLGLGSYAQNIAMGSGTLGYSSSATQTLSGILSGGGGQVNKSGNGTLTLSNSNTYTGLTTVSGGRLVLSGADNSLATGGMTLNGGLTEFATAAAINGTTRNVTVTSPGIVLFDSGAIQTILNTRIVASSSGVIAADNFGATSIDFSATGAGFSSTPSLGAVGNVTYTGTFTPNGAPGSLTYRLGGGGGTLTMSNVNAITGAGNALTAVGSGTVVLGAANNFTGLTTIDSGATLQLGTGVTGQNGSVGSASIVNNGTLTFNNFDNQVLAIPVSGGGSLIKNGAGQTTLSVQETYSGQTTVNAGTLVLAGGNHTLNVNRALVVNGGTLDLGGNRQYAGAFSGNGGTVTGSSTFTTNGASGTYAGGLGGALSFVKAGGSTLTMTGGNANTGTFSVIGGAVTLAGSGALSSATGAVSVNYATLQLDNTVTTESSDRVNDSKAITLATGTINYVTKLGSASTETLGAVDLTANSGISTIQLNRQNAGGTSAVLTLASLTRNTGSMLYINTPNNGDVGNLINGERVMLADNGASLGVANGTIIPGVLVYSNDNLLRPVVYSTTNGFLPLGYAGAPATVENIAGAAPTANVFNTNQTAQSVGSGGQTINSLELFQGANSVSFANATDTLTVTSGNVFMGINGGQNFGTTAIRGELTSGQSELFLYAGNTSNAINSVIKDNGGPVKLVYGSNNGSNVTLTAANTYTGGTVVSNSTLQLTATAGAGTVVIPNAVVPANGLIINNATVSSNLAGMIGSSNIVTLNGNGTLNLTGSNTLAGLAFNSSGGTGNPTVNTGGVLTITGAITSTPGNVAVVPQLSGTLNLNGQPAASISVSAHADGNYVNNATPLNGLTISAVIQNGGLTKTGTGVLNVTNNNTFTGQLTVAQGVLNVDSINNVSTNGRLGNNASSVILGGSGTTGTLEYTGGNLSSNKPLTMATGGTGEVQVDTTATTLTLSGLIDGSGGLTKSGTGTLALTNANTLSGTTLMNTGTLALGNLNALQNSTLNTGTAGAQTVTFTVAGTYNLGGLSGADDLTATGKSLSVGSNGETTIFTGNGVATAFTKVGSGTLSLNGASQNYGTLTTTLGSTNVNGVLGTGTTNVVANADLKFGSVSQTLGSLTIGAGATVTFTSGLASFGGDKLPGISGVAPSFGGSGIGGSAVVPEPGVLGLLLVGALGVLNRRRRCSEK